jgi:hypothetical protein
VGASAFIRNVSQSNLESSACFRSHEAFTNIRSESPISPYIFGYRGVGQIVAIEEIEFLVRASSFERAVGKYNQTLRLFAAL